MRHFDSTKRVHKSNIPMSYKEVHGVTRRYAYLFYYVDMRDDASFLDATTVLWDLFELSAAFERGDIPTLRTGSNTSAPKVAEHYTRLYGRFVSEGHAYSNSMEWCWPHGWGPHDSGMRRIPVKA